MAARRLTALLLGGVLLLAGCGGGSGSSTASSSTAASASGAATTSASGQLGFEGIPIEQGSELASPGTTGTGSVNGIQCGATEQLAYHIHAHVAVYVNGTPRALPGGIGIPGSVVEQSPQGPVAVGGQCIYWLHTHAPDGVIHVESPIQRIYTLGDFFDEWHQPLSATRVGGASGKVTAFVDGKAWTKDPRAIPLDPHAVIQLNVGAPAVAFKTLSWNRTSL